MRLIILIDFSLYTEPLIKVATKWANLLDAELILVHEVPRMVPAMADNNTRYKIIDYEKDEAISMLKSLAERYIPEHISSSFEVTDKPLKYFLPQLMYKKNKTLIMLGLKGTGLLKKVFIGSVATEIINELNHITIGTPLKATCTIPENLIIPVSPEYSINEEQLNLLLSYLRPVLKNIDFVSLTRSGNLKNQSTKFLKDLSGKYKNSISTTNKVFGSKKAFEEFKSYTVDRKNSFIVLQKDGHSFKDIVLKRFFINKIVHDGSIPIIVLPK